MGNFLSYKTKLTKIFKTDDVVNLKKVVASMKERAICLDFEFPNFYSNPLTLCVSSFRTREFNNHNHKCLDYLVKVEKMNVNFVQRNGATPLSIAISIGNVDLVNYILKHVDISNYKGGIPPLTYCCMVNGPNCYKIKELLNHYYSKK